MPIHDELLISLETTAFPTDRLRVRRFAGRESIGRLFEYTLEVVALDRDAVHVPDLVGADVTIVIERGASAGGSDWSGVRRLHGMILAVDDELAGHEAQRVLHLRVVPKAYALAMVETSEIFGDVDVPSIVRAKADAVGLGGAVELRLSGAYAQREFVVQFQESDLAFVSRLVEHLGISLFVDHRDDAAHLVLADAPQGFGWIDGEVAHFRGRGEALDVYSLGVRRTLVEGYYAVRDYNYRTPLVDLTGTHALEEGTHAGGRIEWGSHHKTPAEAQALARVRAEERLSEEVVYTGQSRLPTLGAGLRMRLEGHPELGTLELLVTEVEHRAEATATGFDGRDASGYVNTFRAIPASRTFRPLRTTPRPRIPGIVTGIVDGANEGGRYADIDAEGRYRVRILFDTTPVGERRLSRPVRMLQNHAGEGYGTHFPLKPGTEVAVGFVGGDPDRPVIVGAAPNPTKPSPVTGVNPGVHRIRTSTGVTVDLVE
jgi:type VI secretion system secreted protein VgrG